jgi:hypothetical protein
MANTLPTNTNGVPVDSMDVNEIYGAIEKIGKQVIRSAINDESNPLNLFEKGNIDNGVAVEQLIIQMVEGQAWDKSGTTTLDKRAVEYAVRYFQELTETQFSTTVQKSEIKKILTSASSVEDVAGRMVGILAASENFDKYEKLKALLAAEASADVVGTGANEDGKAILKMADVATPEAALARIKDLVKGFKFVSNKYNRAGIKRGTYADNIVIVMPYTVRNKIDIDVLAGVFNLSKAEMEARIVETDAEDGEIYILDKDLVVCYTKDYDMTTQLNGQGRFMNYFLTVERLYGCSPLFNGVHFKATF